MSFLNQKKENFNASWYLDQNPDVKESGMDPYEHYTVHGIHEGRKPAPAPIYEKFLVVWILYRLYSALSSGTLFKMFKGITGLILENGFSEFYKKVYTLYLTKTLDNDYQKWHTEYGELREKDIQELTLSLKKDDIQPLISIIMPVYEPNLVWLEEAIESVKEQIYPNWELCIVDDYSTRGKVRDFLIELSKNDGRIKVALHDKNKNISEASNSAINLASGEFIALMDQDDLITKHALCLAVKVINSTPDVQLIYSDEDKINEDKILFDPYFKTDWNKDLFYSQNMFSHFGIFRKDLVESVGSFRVGLEGAQDYDLVLRCIEKIDQEKIVHIPHVLYHWRSHSDSTAFSSNTKPYARNASVMALNDHFSRLKIKANAQYVENTGYYRVNYMLPDVQPLVTIIIPTYNNYKLIKQCVDSIFQKTTYLNYEVLIINNGSDDKKVLNYFESLSDISNCQVVEDDGEFNFSRINNTAVYEHSNGDIVCLLNDDTEVISPDWLTEMVSHALRPEIGAVGAKLWYKNNTLQHGGVILGIGGIADHAHKRFGLHSLGYFSRMVLVSQFSAVTAACLVVRKSVYQEVGGLDECNLSVAFNDVDFCLKVRDAGYKNLWTPYAELYHYESVSRGYEDSLEKKERFEKEVIFMQTKWKEIIENDPAYSPNLTIHTTNFSYAFPPRVRW